MEDFGDITEFSVSIWIREYEDQTFNMRHIFSYSSEGTGKDNEILIGRDVEADLIGVCIAGTCNSQENMICKLILQSIANNRDGLQVKRIFLK